MTITYEIPFDEPPEAFPITLAGISYQLKVRWSPIDSVWLLDIADASANPLVTSIPLVTGVNLLEQFQYLGIGGALYVQTDFDPDAVPTFDNLGTNGHLYFVPS